MSKKKNKKEYVIYNPNGERVAIKEKFFNKISAQEKALKLQDSAKDKYNYRRFIVKELGED